MAPLVKTQLLAMLLLAFPARCAAFAADGACASGSCGSEDVGLLQLTGGGVAVHKVQTPELDTHKVQAQETWPPLDLRQAFTASRPAPSCRSGMAMEISELTLAEGVSLKYNIDNFTDGSCSESSENGPSTCCVKFGSNATVSGQVSVPESLAIGEGTTIEMHVQFATRVFGRWAPVGNKNVTCPICGANCTIGNVTLAGLINLPVGDIELPECEEPFSGTVDIPALPVMFPEEDPIGFTVRVQTSVKIAAKGGEVAASQATLTLWP